ncbi:HAMP domain-containing sensor histidine kinase [Paenibacillus hunanensis]|uniref:sensor histidine kinase n=1 Tax=Paenibacillus hunanensis TaxID=539262 RepID=UPI002A6A298E|nr:HAMP domain-containing sensor histidine kinase [Paenibacillus hunanensis]WPP41749.1 HAMP domain-containing sensor histidine kinase [Paenibacillus hunanensis]
MKLRLKLILLFLIHLFIVVNVIYLGFALLNSVSLDLLSRLSGEVTVADRIGRTIAEYHTVIIFLLVVLSYSWILISPILHILEWIHLLANGQYDEPIDKKGIPRSISRRRGKIKYTFVLYKGVIDHLHHLSYTLEQNKKAREELETMKREWVADIAHDLKTPLSYVKGYSSMLLEQGQWHETDQRKFISKIEEQAEYMEHLLLDLNDTFRFEAPGFTIVKQKQDILASIRELLIDYTNNHTLADHQIQLLNDPEEKMMYAFNGPFLQRAFVNILGNAIQHNPPQTTIKVHVQRMYDRLTIQIEDDGNGMSPDTAAHLFERYYNGRQQSARKSSGLGMSIVKQLVEAHNGTIEVESEEGKGTVVKITLPY